MGGGGNAYTFNHTEFNLTENLLRDYARSDTKHPESAGNEERARFQREDLGHSGRCTEQKDKVSRNSSGLHPCGRHTAIRNTQTDTRSINTTGVDYTNSTLYEPDLGKRGVEHATRDGRNLFPGGHMTDRRKSRLCWLFKVGQWRQLEKPTARGSDGSLAVGGGLGILTRITKNEENGLETSVRKALSFCLLLHR